MNVSQLMKALDDESNEHLFHFTLQTIREMNLKVLKELYLSKQETMDLYTKLKNYRYIDEMNELKSGTYVRWIPIDTPEHIHLTKGAIFCEMKITDEGVFCVCKNMGFPVRHFYLSIDTNLIFQKLTNQELVLLSALEHLSK